MQTSTPITAAAPVGPVRGFFLRHGRTVGAAAGGLGTVLAMTGKVLAQAASPSGGLGAQMNLMSSEAINSGGIAMGALAYLAAGVCFLFGVWALWQSRQPQNRDAGNVGKGIAGLVLCGLFATMGVWINKASITASGGNSTVNNTPAMVQFGSGG